MGDSLTEWRAVPRLVENAIEGLTNDELDLRGGSNHWSIRETVHHLVEASLIASNIVLAGLAKSGCTYDWSWVTPDREWLQRVGYTRTSVNPALTALNALCDYIVVLVLAGSDTLTRHVRLLDTPGAELRVVTIEAVIQDEVEHARIHLREIAEIRRQHLR